MKKWQSIALLSIPTVFALLILTSVASADKSYQYGNADHGYAGQWKKKNYTAYSYYYKPKPNAPYKYHYVYQYPKDRYNKKGYYYYTNGDTGKVWGRCQHGTNNYELLSEDHQKKSLEDVKEDWFVPQKKMPPVPGMTPPTPILDPPEPPPVD